MDDENHYLNQRSRESKSSLEIPSHLISTELTKSYSQEGTNPLFSILNSQFSSLSKTTVSKEIAVHKSSIWWPQTLLLPFLLHNGSVSSRFFWDWLGQLGAWERSIPLLVMTIITIFCEEIRVVMSTKSHDLVWDYGLGNLVWHHPEKAIII